MTANYFTEKEALETIIELLENGFDSDYSELHQEAFNMDYYIIGTWEAKEALKEYDVFEAIERVMEYEQDNFGEVNTELYNPEQLANMLWYIVGEEALNDSGVWEAVIEDSEDGYGNPTDNAKMIKHLEKRIKEL